MSKIAGRTRLAYGGGRRYQTGLGALGWLIVLAIASFALTCFFRVGPVYLDYWNTKQSLDVVMQDGKTPSLSKTELQRAIGNQLDVSMIKTIKAKASFDVALMTSHVAQYLVGDDEWRTALSALRRAVVPGGRLVFDSRDPAYRSWATWSPVESRHAVPLPDGGDVLVWSEATETDPGVVEVTRHYEFPDRATSSSVIMRFRTEAELRASLAETGWAVDFVFGGWQRQPAGAGGRAAAGARASSGSRRRSRRGSR